MGTRVPIPSAASRASAGTFHPWMCIVVRI